MSKTNGRGSSDSRTSSGDDDYSFMHGGLAAELERRIAEPSSKGIGV
jgi:hypothetical protein